MISRLSSDDRETMKSYVEAGGLLVIAYVGGSFEMSLLNTVFGFSLESQSCSSTSLAGGASGTCYEAHCKDRSCSTLSSLNAIRCVRSSSVTANSGGRVIYSSGTAASVFEIPVGAGFVVGLAPDWYDSNSDWDHVLQISTFWQVWKFPPPFQIP